MAQIPLLVLRSHTHYDHFSHQTYERLVIISKLHLEIFHCPCNLDLYSTTLPPSLSCELQREIITEVLSEASAVLSNEFLLLLGKEYVTCETYSAWFSGLDEIPLYYTHHSEFL
jgi:hypothetical protein